jgi:16S rRNA (guanine966-N2)-methyltransferase
MRIVAGRYKGRRLQGPAGPGLRPTSDGLRETLFNVLGARVEGARVLDGFAGTGAVGLEALSRGAAHALFVERDRRAADLIGRNVEACGAAALSSVARREFAGLAAREPSRGVFEIVFLDPPYDATRLDDIVREGAQWLAPGGVLVLEHSRRRPAPDRAAGLARYRQIVAGDSALSFYAAPGVG